MTPEGNVDQDSHASPRRHKSAVQRSVSTDVSKQGEAIKKTVSCSDPLLEETIDFNVMF